MAIAYGAATKYSATHRLDPLLVPFIYARDDDRARAHLATLIHQYADPVILASVRRHGSIGIRRRWAPQSADAADLRGETVRRILTRLWAMRGDTASPPGGFVCSDFICLVRVTARWSCIDQIRKNKKVSPFSSFNTGSITYATSSMGEEFSEFDFEDPATKAITAAASASAHDDICTLIEKRVDLQSLWKKVRALPRNHRLALLYNLRDKNGVNLLPLLSLCDIASPSELAEALEVPASELDDLLDQLPMPDDKVAAALGLTPRNIANLRMAARRWLKDDDYRWSSPGPKARRRSVRKRS